MFSCFVSFLVAGISFIFMFFMLAHFVRVWIAVCPGRSTHCAGPPWDMQYKGKYLKYAMTFVVLNPDYFIHMVLCPAYPGKGPFL